MAVDAGDIVFRIGGDAGELNKAIAEASKIAQNSAQSMQNAFAISAQRIEKEMAQAAAASAKHWQNMRQSVEQNLSQIGANFQRMGNIIGQASRTVGLGMMAAGGAIAGGLGLGIKESNAFESVMANVAKATGLAGEELKKMGKDIDNLSLRIPVTAVELGKIAETGGQFGIAAKDIVKFTEVVAALGVSSDLTGEEGAKLLAQFAGITKMPMGQFENLASAIVALGNEGTSTEKSVAEMALRLVGAAHAAKISEADILGIAAALSNVGIEAEMGGSAFSTLIKDISMAAYEGGDKLDKLAAVAGMTSEEFAKLGNENVAKALEAFIVGLGRLQDEGANSAVILKDLQYTEVRMSDAISRVAGAGDMMTKSMQMANKEFTSNTALAREAALQYATTESQITLFKNTFTSSMRLVGDAAKTALAPVATELANMMKSFREWIEADPQMQATIARLGIALSAMLIPLGALLFFMPALVAAFVGGFTLIYLTVWTFYLSYVVLSTLITATSAFISAALTSAFWPVYLAIAVVVGALWWWYNDSLTIGNGLSSLWAFVKDNLNTIFNNLGTNVAEIWNKIKDIIINAMEDAGWVTADQAEKMRKALELDPVVVQQLWNKIKGFIIEAWNSIKVASQDAVNGMIDGLNVIINKFSILYMNALMLAGAIKGIPLGPLGIAGGALAGEALALATNPFTQIDPVNWGMPSENEIYGPPRPRQRAQANSTEAGGGDGGWGGVDQSPWGGHPIPVVVTNPYSGMVNGREWKSTPATNTIRRDGPIGLAGFSGGGNSANVNINLGGVQVNSEQDAAMLSRKIAQQLRQEMRGLGYAT